LNLEFERDNDRLTFFNLSFHKQTKKLTPPKQVKQKALINRRKSTPKVSRELEATFLESVEKLVIDTNLYLLYLPHLQIFWIGIWQKNNYNRQEEEDIIQEGK
jgi:hypothetical protein